MNSLSAYPSKSINGLTKVPGDKSMSHRAIMLSAVTVGETMITGLLEGEDVLCTAEAMSKMGASIKKSADGIWRVHGVGLGGLHAPSGVLDMGNSGTSIRLLMGLVGGHDITADFEGDASLSRRPMNRVIKPLEMMGVEFKTSEGGRLPIHVKGTPNVLPIEYELPVASAQVKSAILLAGLNARGVTRVIEGKPTRDHTENMLKHFGVEVSTDVLEDGRLCVSLAGQQTLQPCAVDIPGDPSSAAFPAVAAALIEGSMLELYRVGINDRRNGIFTCLQEMGCDIEYKHEKIEAGERIANIVISGNGALQGIDVPASRVPSMIDEFPILAMAAACANGTTRMSGLGELRVKECDRLAVVAQGLKACGVDLEEGEDTLIIHGNGQAPKGGAHIVTHLDHRIAMSFLILGGVTQEPITIDNSAPIKTSFPNFVKLMNELGSDIR